MPGTADLNAVEVLVQPQNLWHTGLQVVEVLHGTSGSVPTQQAAVHARAIELLTVPQQQLHTQLNAAEVLWLDLSFELQVDAKVVEVLHGTVGTPPVQESSIHTGQVVELLVEPPPLAQQKLSVAEMLVSYDAGVASVSDISGSTSAPATFDGTTSLGWITGYWWEWVSVPGGSALTNSAQPFPDSGGTSPVDMTDNEVLYHAEETAGSTGTDTSGNGNNATLNTITVGVGGQVGSYAWSFTGSTSYAQVTSDVVIGTTWTIAFWFFNLAANSTWRTATRGPSTDHHIIVESGSDRLGAWVAGGFRPCVPNFDMTAAAHTGWHQFVAVGTASGNTEFYIDGALAGTIPGFRGVEDIRYLGNTVGGGNQRFADRIDELAIWSRELSLREVQELYVLQSGNYAGVGEAFEFTPDVDGVYTVQLTAFAGLDGNLTVDTALATIGASAAKGFQGATIRERKYSGLSIRARRRRFKE
jgi:hypothetical protein